MDLIFLIFFCPVTVYTVVGQTEVEGSPYHYNEQILARVISLELRLQQMEESTPEVCSIAENDAQAVETSSSPCVFIEQVLASISRQDMRLADVETSLTLLQPGNTACDDEWIPFQSSCYWFGNSDMDFERAKALCEVSGGHLVSILNNVESDFITRHVSIMAAPYYWTGLTDIESEGNWIWSGTDEEYHFVNWYRGEPNGGRSENCVVIYKSLSKWVDIPCTNKYRPICKK